MNDFLSLLTPLQTHSDAGRACTDRFIVAVQSGDGNVTVVDSPELRTPEDKRTWLAGLLRSTPQGGAPQAYGFAYPVTLVLDGRPKQVVLIAAENHSERHAHLYARHDTPTATMTSQAGRSYQWRRGEMLFSWGDQFPLFGLLPALAVIPGA